MKGAWGKREGDLELLNNKCDDHHVVIITILLSIMIAIVEWKFALNIHVIRRFDFIIPSPNYSLFVCKVKLGGLRVNILV